MEMIFIGGHSRYFSLSLTLSRRDEFSTNSLLEDEAAREIRNSRRLFINFETFPLSPLFLRVFVADVLANFGERERENNAKHSCETAMLGKKMSR
jgi:hypothetical protein